MQSVVILSAIDELCRLITSACHQGNGMVIQQRQNRTFVLNSLVKTLEVVKQKLAWCHRGCVYLHVVPANITPLATLHLPWSGSVPADIQCCTQRSWQDTADKRGIWWTTFLYESPAHHYFHKINLNFLTFSLYFHAMKHSPSWH